MGPGTGNESREPVSPVFSMTHAWVPAVGSICGEEDCLTQIERGYEPDVGHVPIYSSGLPRQESWDGD